MGPGGRRDIPDALVWALLGGLVSIPMLAWLGAQVAAIITGGHFAAVGLDDATRAIPRLVGDPSDPAAAFQTRRGPGPIAFWASTIGLVSAAGLAVTVVTQRLSRRSARPGMARRTDLRGLSARAVTSRASVLRPDLPDNATDIRALEAAGVRLGRHHPSGLQLYGTVEDSILTIAPPRTGKTARVVIPTVLDHAGPAVVTSTRWDTVTHTIARRANRGPVWVFDADQSNPRPLPQHVRAAAWSPVHGCEDPQTAMIRARSLARAAGAGGGVDNGDFWAGHAVAVIQSYLHAAALRGLSVADVRRWSLDPAAREPATILRDSPAAPEWAAELLSRARYADRQRDGIWGVVQQSLDALRNPRFLEHCSPPPGEGFDPAALFDRAGTLYIVGQADTQDVVAPIVAALVEAVITEARTRAARSVGGRLAPTLLVALDEVANIAPLPTLPTLVADGGGSGITTLVVLQSRAQARARWGEDAADAIVAACTHRLILGGGGELKELEDLARLVGERDEEVRSHTWQASTSGQASTSTGLRRVPIITPADLQALPKGRGVLCSPNARPAEITVQAWWDRPDADQLEAPKPTPHISDAPEPDGGRPMSATARTQASQAGDE